MSGQQHAILETQMDCAGGLVGLLIKCVFVGAGKTGLACRNLLALQDACPQKRGSQEYEDQCLHEIAISCAHSSSSRVRL